MELDFNYATSLQLDLSATNAANQADIISQTNIGQQEQFSQLLLQTHREPLHILPQLMKPVPETQLIMLLSGAMKMKLWQHGKEYKYQTKPGDLFLTAAHGDSYEMQWNSNNEIPIHTFQIYLNNDLLAKTAESTCGIDPGSVNLLEGSCLTDPFLQQLAYALKSELKNPDSATQLFMDSAAQLIAIHLLKRHCRAQHQIAEATGRLPELRLRQVKDYISDHLHLSISLNDLASVACVSPFHFCRLFKKATGKSPNQYVIIERMNKARNLLFAGSPVSDTAIAVGYHSTGHFTNTFRRHTGFLPLQYQKLAT